MRRLLALALIAACVPAPSEPDVGRVVLHRLNRAEYDNTVRDLLGSELRPGLGFPADDFGHGFDNQAATLSTSPLHLEMLEGAARTLVARSVLPSRPEPGWWRVEAEGAEATQTTGGEQGGAWNLWSNGAVSAPVRLPYSGTYTVSVRAWGQQAGPDPVAMSLEVDGVERARFDVTGEEPELFQHTLRLSSGNHTLSAVFLNDFYEPPDSDRNLVVDFIEVEGPPDGPVTRPAGYERVFLCDPAVIGEEECASFIARVFGERAWRRPLLAEEIERLMVIFLAARAEDLAFEPAVGLMVQALLISPHFWYRPEPISAPDTAQAQPLTAWELASRLSYFLWSSMPDDALFAAARDGSLLEDDVLLAQVDRMLADPKAMALVDQLGAQWLFVRAVDDAFPDYAWFPTWDEQLRASMREEMRRSVADVLLSDRPLTDLLTDDTAWVDARLAQHYGIPEPTSDWERVSLEGTGRVGLLTRAGLLTALSYPTRTSPTKRGAWVLDNLLCEAPPPPPANVEALAEVESEAGATVRERLELHRTDPVCRSCHQVMDPIGLALEHFDGVGQWREEDNGQPIDATGSMPDGTVFNDARDMAAFIASDPRFDRCAVHKTFTRALGRAPGVEDLVWFEMIEADYHAGGGSFPALAKAVVLSPAFRNKRGEPAGGAP